MAELDRDKYYIVFEDIEYDECDNYTVLFTFIYRI